jgi:HNH endonuclease
MNDSHGDRDASPRATDTTDDDCDPSAARTPTRCLACEGVLDGSLEHVFPQALGGTKKSRNLYCRACNVRLGSEVDAALTKDFEFFTTALDVKRDRGTAPPLRVTTTDGKKVYLGPGGVPSPAGPSVTVIDGPDGQKHITITAPMDRPDLHGHMLAQVAKELGVSVDALGKGSASLTSTSVGTVNGRFAVGGPEQLRAVAKIALGFLALAIGDDVFTSHYAALRLAVARGTSIRAGRQPPFPALSAPVLPPTDGAQHRVLLYTTESATWAHVEVYGAFGYAVLLADVPVANGAMPYVWGQNPTTGASGEGRAQGAPLPAPVHMDVETDRNDLAGLYRAMKQVAIDTAHKRMVDEEIAIAFAGLDEGAELSEAFIGRLSQRFAERLLAIENPNHALNLSQPIKNRDELEGIRRGLNRAQRSKKA